MGRIASSKIRVELSADELQAIIKLAEDQIFPVRFIDPKMPGINATRKKFKLRNPP